MIVYDNIFDTIKRGYKHHEIFAKCPRTKCKAIYIYIYICLYISKIWLGTQIYIRIHMEMIAVEWLLSY